MKFWLFPGLAILVLLPALSAGADTGLPLPLLVGDGSAAPLFRPNWRSLPDTPPRDFSKQDFQLYGRWGRVIPYHLTLQNERLSAETEAVKWNPYQRLDAYTYGAYALYHEKLMLIMPGVRMEFNKIDEFLILCLDVAAPMTFNLYQEDLQVGSSLLTSSDSDLTWAIHAAFSLHAYLAGQIQGFYVGPIVGFQSFYFKGEGFYAFPFLGVDAGIRLNIGTFTFTAGAAIFGMALKHVHPDWGSEMYAGIGFLI